MSNRVMVCIRDGACGPGGVHCYCCARNAKANRRGKRINFSRIVRVRVERFVAKDLVRNPF